MVRLFRNVDFDADSALSEVQCLQKVLRPTRIAIVGGAKSGKSYVGLARFLPAVVIDGADAVTAHGVDSRESISLRPAGDAGTWRFSLETVRAGFDTGVLRIPQALLVATGAWDVNQYLSWER